MKIINSSPYPTSGSIVFFSSLACTASDFTKAYDTNTRLALASLDNGIGFSHVNSILTALEIPSLTRSTYKKREREIGQATELVARESCEKMLIQESEMVKEKGVLADSDGLLPLSVSYDMGWSK